MKKGVFLVKIQSINDPAFLKYGKVLTGYDLDGLIAALRFPTMWFMWLPALSWSGFPFFRSCKTEALEAVPFRLATATGIIKS